MTEPLKVFVGTDVNGGCAECQMVFEYSLKKQASVPVEIEWMRINEDPKDYWSGWNTKTWSTPFSGFRWGIPERCGFKGKAIYCDDDQMWLTDPLELWNAPFEEGKFVQAKFHKETGEIRYCVMLWDNEAAEEWMLPVGHNKANQNFHGSMTQLVTASGGVQHFDRNWNNFDGENDSLEDIHLLHFTDMSSNPGVALAVKRLGGQAEHWYNGPVRKHRRQDVVDIFHQYYNEALEAGYKIENYLPENQIKYAKQDQSNYHCRNGFDVTLGQ